MKEKKPFNVEIGQRVKQSRESAGLTQESFSELVGLGVKHVSAIECGAVGLSLPTLKKVCEILSVPADDVLFDHAESVEQSGRDAEIQTITARMSRLPEDEFIVVKDIMNRLLEALALNQQHREK